MVAGWALTGSNLADVGLEQVGRITRTAFSSNRQPEQAKRTLPILIHFHIFKNAGSSIDHSLHKSFGDRWTTFEVSDVPGSFGPQSLESFLTKKPSIQAISSHIEKPFLQIFESIPIVMLRHPIERARSVFKFLQRDIGQRYHAFARGSLAEYVTWELEDPDGGAHIRNYQVYHLSDASVRPDNLKRASSNQDLDQVREFLLACPAFGLVSEFQASCREFEANYRPLFPSLSFFPVMLNASPHEAGTEANAIERTRADLGEKLFRRLCEANELDLALYEFARSVFAARVRGETG
jgi:hypothetical protein